MENKMKKDLGVLEAVFPMPVLMIATYNVPDAGADDCDVQ